MRPSSPRVVVTRPAADARRWVAALQARGIVAESLPLIEIAALDDTRQLQAVWQSVAQYAALMFVSAAAVRHFMQAIPAGQTLPTAQAWATGPATQAALQAAGWPVERIRSPAPDAGQFDSEALWAVVQDEVRHWCGQSVLLVRGADAHGQLAGRDWLARQLQAAGLRVAQCVAYVRRLPVLDAPTRLRAEQALQDGSWWLFSSAEAAANLQQWLPAGIGPLSRALATHDRIAQRLRAQGWGRVEVVPALLEAQVASIECLS